MKAIKIFVLITILAGCNTYKEEVGCNCNEVKDKNVDVREYPYLYWEYELYVDYCDGGMSWVQVQQSTYNSHNRGDCY